MRGGINMRQIKFRGWDINNKKIFKVGEIKWDTNENLINAGDSWYSNGYYAPGENWGTTLMQYTGYKDKNEKEIYEGDIVRYTSYYNGKTNIDLVQWKEIEDMEGYYHKNYCEWIVGYDTLIDIVKNIHTDTIQIEVIGNLYENFELLEKSIDNGDME
jgi:uncharacterized phage protein (TIGR01671 family)